MWGCSLPSSAERTLAGPPRRESRTRHTRCQEMRARRCQVALTCSARAVMRRLLSVSTEPVRRAGPAGPVTSAGRGAASSTSSGTRCSRCALEQRHTGVPASLFPRVSPSAHAPRQNTLSNLPFAAEIATPPPPESGIPRAVGVGGLPGTALKGAGGGSSAGIEQPAQVRRGCGAQGPCGLCSEGDGGWEAWARGRTAAASGGARSRLVASFAHQSLVHALVRVRGCRRGRGPGPASGSNVSRREPRRGPGAPSSTHARFLGLRNASRAHGSAAGSPSRAFAQARRVHRKLGLQRHQQWQDVARRGASSDNMATCSRQQPGAHHQQ